MTRRGLSARAPSRPRGRSYGRFRHGLPPKTRGDYTFILHMIETLKPDSGRMAVIVPHGVLFRKHRGGRRVHLRPAYLRPTELAGSGFQLPRHQLQ
ncbi:N-6 DNA methylase [Endothiovibrio diazotrophicus]